MVSTIQIHFPSIDDFVFFEQYLVFTSKELLVQKNTKLLHKQHIKK